MGFFLLIAASLLAGYLFGKLANYLRIPRVTGYIIAGLILGPSFLNLFHQDNLKDIHFLHELGMGFILVNIGSYFDLSRFRKIGRGVIWLSLFETGLCLLTVFISMIIYTHEFTLPLYLGILALSTAPAATYLVINEYDARGPITTIILILVGLNNAICILLFNLFFHVFGIGGLHIIEAMMGMGRFLWAIGGAIILGLAIGFLMCYLEEGLEEDRDIIVVTVGSLVLTLSVASILDVSHFLACLVLGAVIVNASIKKERIFEKLNAFAYPVYVVFFVLSGANIHLDVITAVGVMGVLYVIMRLSGKIVGIYLASFFRGLSLEVRRYAGIGLTCQAGLAIGLAMILKQSGYSQGQVVLNIILATAIFFEIIGPIMVRFAVVRAGEVKIAKLLKRPGVIYPHAVRDIVIRAFRSMGLPLWKKGEGIGDLEVRHIMRKNIEPIHEDMHFNDILRYIEHVHLDHFPVVNSHDEFVGMISYPDIRDILLNRELFLLVVAGDLTKPTPLNLYPNDSLDTALEKFERGHVSCLPVLDPKDPGRLVGILEQRDLLSAYKK